MMRHAGFVLLSLFFCLFQPSPSRADYADELRGQMEGLKRQSAKQLDVAYFHDMGILARKADEADLNLLTTEIVGSLLWKKMEDYLKNETAEINRLYATDVFRASRRLAGLNRFEHFYEPTEEFLSSTNGQALALELVGFRKRALDGIQSSCSDYTLSQALSALRKTGLYVTGRPEEILSLRDLTQALDCCLAWKSKIHYVDEKTFKVTNEEGIFIEEGKLVLETNPRDYSEARWNGDWIYRFEGKDGTAEGISHATLKYRRGDDKADLTISAARVSSVGWIKLPVSVSGSQHTAEIEGNPIQPRAVFSKENSVPLAGCRENKV